ncbi:MAG: hypothetical protein Ta2F_05240 [Termitinemataceae bacterium]|nr:MAG: hypothetical protein Ta2F_05240 [Termitinemataceae bacterium]
MRFIFVFTIFIVALCSVITVLGIRQSIHAVSEIFAQQGLPIVRRAAEVVDGDSFKRLAITLDSSDPFYIETQRKLLQLKKDMGCTFLYTMAPYHDSIYRFIIDGSGEIAETEGSDFSPIGTEDDISSYDDSFLHTMESGELSYSGIVNQGEWGYVMSVYSPIFDSDQKIVGIIGCDFDAELLHNLLVEGTIQHVAFSFASVIAGLVFILIFMRMIFNPLAKASGILREIADGEGDLTKRINLNTHDEIGTLASYFDQTLEKIKNLIVTIKSEIGVLSGVGDKLGEDMTATAVSVNQMTDTIKFVKANALNQSLGVSETNTTMVKISDSIKTLNEHVTRQTESVSQSSSAIEQMLANIQSVTQTLIKNAENVASLSDASEFGKNGLHDVSNDIQGIAHESEGLLEINAVMQNIASQTNLLSMNAAIEAAHAGESGKGFAVVADEIRKLAENSSTQSKTISDVLKKIHAGIEKITRGAESVIARFEAIDSGVKHVEEQGSSIRNAMEEQGEGSQQILEAVSNLNEITQSVRDCATKMLSGAEQIISEGTKLLSQTNEITNGMNEMTTGAEKITGAVADVNEESIKNKASIKALLDGISRFKVE